MTRSTRIIIEAIPPEQARLECYRDPPGGFGDWFVDPKTGDIHIQVTGSDVWDQKELFLVALHELVEARLCFRDGVTQGQVDQFDAEFNGYGEPGDNPEAPYRSQHRDACLIEFLMARFLGINDYGVIR